ncbi:MAG: calcium/sodium antiporter [Gammaproteobacteria bacterium]|nr:calcium/sodium antiporter [Gammaproteobacteria bacterium]
MWLPILALILGFVALIWSADRFVSGAAATASNLNVSKVLIGLTVVSVGTSAPEILVALAAALEESSSLAIGNAIGSNIANVGLVLGVTAMVAPLPFAPGVLKLELPWLIAATLLALICLFDLWLGTFDGLLLLAGLWLVMHRLMRKQRGAAHGIRETLEEELQELPSMTTARAVVWTAVGLAVLLAAAWILVWAATEIARLLGVSELVIGLTVVAVGTSLPELAATLGAAIKGHPDIAIGNVVGSNILNILAVMAVPALVHPVGIEAHVLWRDFGMMAALTALLVLFAYAIGSRPTITRFEGSVMVLAWIGYMVLLYHQA